MKTETTHSIAHQIADLLPSYSSYPKIFLINETGIASKAPDVEKQISAILQSRDKERRCMEAEAHALATVQSQEKLFDSLAAQGVMTMKITFSANCCDNTFGGPDDQEGELEITDIKRAEASVFDDQGILTVTNEDTFLKAIGDELMSVLDSDWDNWHNNNDSVGGTFVIDVANRTINVTDHTYECEHQPFGH